MTKDIIIALIHCYLVHNNHSLLAGTQVSKLQLYDTWIPPQRTLSHCRIVATHTCDYYKAKYSYKSALIPSSQLRAIVLLTNSHRPFYMKQFMSSKMSPRLVKLETYWIIYKTVHRMWVLCIIMYNIHKLLYRNVIHVDNVEIYVGICVSIYLVYLL